MKKVAVIGSGASGVHFALTLLEKEYQVVMIDVGFEGSAHVNPEHTYVDLKKNLEDPVGYFLGSNFGSVIYPDFSAEYYGFPPSKDYVFETPHFFNVEARGFQPLVSFARGGLAEAWTGAVYPFSEAELSDFPFTYSEIEPYYNEVAKRVGITGERDDMSRFLPFHEHILEPLPLDEHSALILGRYEKNKGYLNRRLGAYLGRSRVATISCDKDGRLKCNSSGRCLWGCPSGSLYTPSLTLKKCLAYPNFTYIPHAYASHFNFDAAQRVTSVVSRSTRDQGTIETPVDCLVLAAGTLSSSRIFLESIFKKTGKIVKLVGFMDNRQIMMPFLNLSMVGKPYKPESYQYHLLGMGIETEDPRHFIHGLITTLKTATVHPLICKLPLDLKSATFAFRNIRSAMGVVNVNFPDHRRDESYLTLEADGNSSPSKLLICYQPREGEKELMKATIKTVRKTLFKLGCLVPPGMIHVRPMGASVHYAGTIPMTDEAKALTTTKFCRSRDFPNLYIADGTTFPFLPSKNITFTLMANAIRVAEEAF